MNVTQLTKLREIASWLDEHGNKMANDLESLCNLNSGSYSLRGLTETAEWLEKFFAPLGSPANRVNLDPFQSIDDLGCSTECRTAHGLRWEYGNPDASVDRRLLLTIHFDTVYGPESAFQKCERYEIKTLDGQIEHRMRGPGVIDAKGGIVVLRWAMLAVQRFVDLYDLAITVLLTPDEEIGSPSTTKYWSEMASRFHFAMLFEPALADNALVSHRKGTGTFIFVVRGRSAHAGRNFRDGRNAIVHASKIAVALDALNGIRPNVTINVGRLRGGDAVNVVPDLAVLRANVRVSDSSDQQWILDQLQSVVQQFRSGHDGLTVELHGGLSSPPKMIDDETQRWMLRVEEVGKALDQPIRWNLSGGASDGNKLASFGLRNLDTFGPEGDLLHSDLEWVRLSSLPRKAALTAALIQSIALSKSNA